MALVCCGSNPAESFLAGAILFDTRSPTYHAMILLTGASETHPDGQRFRVAEMDKPRLNLNAFSEAIGASNYVGYFPDELSPEQHLIAVETAVSLRADPVPSGQNVKYSLKNHGIHDEDPNRPGGFLPGIHCSCASFVEYCYESIATENGNVDLVDARHVPPMSKEELWVTFGQEMHPGEPYNERLMKFLQKRFELEGAGPWKILIPAYQMKACERRLSELPYRPLIDDHPFEASPVLEDSPEES